MIVFTHTDSCLQPHPANIESAWLLSQVCYYSKTKRNFLTLYIPLHWFPPSAFFSFFLLFIIIHILLSHLSEHSCSLLLFLVYVLIRHIRFCSFVQDNSYMKYLLGQCKVETKKKIVMACLSCFNRRLALCSISSGYYEYI